MTAACNASNGSVICSIIYVNVSTEHVVAGGTWTTTVTQCQRTASPLSLCNRCVIAPDEAKTSAFFSCNCFAFHVAQSDARALAISSPVAASLCI